MATLEEQRRAIGANNEAARRAIGTNNEAARRAIGQRIEAERRGTAVVEDINRLQQPAPARRTLRTIQPLGELPPARGVGTYKPPPAATGGGGIASPLTERTRVEAGQVVPDRDYYADMSMPTSDGIFTFIVKPVQTIRWLDNDNQPGQINLAAPSPL